jgi:nicotinamidase-related amidase
MKKALISIDYTNDFVADNGALTVGKPAQDILNRMLKITEKFANENEDIIYAIDLHSLKDIHHPEFKLFPEHNIAGTIGRKLYDQYETQYQNLVLGKENAPIFLDKTRYSAFAGTNLDILLRERGITEVHLIGVCTDICVLHTAVDAYNLGYKIVVHEDAVASFNPTGHNWALEHFKNTLGAKVITNYGGEK